eukprot:TRINITY_DN16466_c0_g1_i1.p1 TRINITY_DN16466_c0_g1~~TRINITY_DN16466_c0_g1_i1.p1  ORF type:complete len:116 (+),score=10.13 TRINITY_DN16466_c0_g1_i1:114-461(+)
MALEFYVLPVVSSTSTESAAIEMEPRTLSEVQLQEAREAAVDVMQQKPPDEALSIFTKGLRPVRSVKEMEKLQSNGLDHKPHVRRSIPNSPPQGKGYSCTVCSASPLYTPLSAPF